ncbi:MAG: hypothetical protein K2G44_07235 [Clostridia bacterium]|nr:hypothetical protein [Clostridia bacterium]
MNKRILALLLAVVSCIGVCLSLVGCNDECAHTNKMLIKDTTTCVANGIVTYQCRDCGITIEQEKNALGHNYEIISNTATCTTNGLQTSQCSRCQKREVVNVAAKGHSYGYKGICSICSKFQYDIQLSVSLPKEFKYEYKAGNHIYSKFILTKLSFQIEYSSIYINFEGEKTYDEDGAYGNERIYCTVVLKEKDTGKIIGSDSLYATNLIVGQTFKNDYHKICNVSDLESGKTYILEVVDRII